MIPRHFERQFPGTAARCGLPAIAGPLVAVMGRLAGVGLMLPAAALASHMRPVLHPGGSVVRAVSGRPFDGGGVGLGAVGSRFRLEQGTAHSVTAFSTEPTYMPGVLVERTRIECAM